jgi:hypothetical protein
MTDTVRAPFRLAIRAEGEFINAYFASIDTMKDAMLLGSIKRVPCDKDRSIFDQWVGVMANVLQLACKEALGEITVEMIIEPAPEHERAGNA